MLNNSNGNQKMFAAWADPKHYEARSWREIDMAIQGKITFSKMRNGELYAVAHTQMGKIMYADCTKQKCGEFTEVSVLNSNLYNAKGSVYMVDFADGRIAWFAISEKYHLLCSVTENIDKPILWEIIGAGVFSEPYPLARSYGGIQIFVRDIVNGISHRWYTDEGWSNWEALYGHIAGNVNSEDNINDLPVLLVRGPENAVWGKEHLVPNGWGEWHCLGGQFKADPVALRDAEKNIWAFAIDFENKINIAQVLPDAKIKCGWQQMDGLVAGSIACACIKGVPVLAAIAADGSIILRRYKNAWSEWISLGLNGIAYIDLQDDGKNGVILAQDRNNRVFIHKLEMA